MNRLQTFFIALVLSVNFSGCAFLPSNFALFSTGANLALTAATGKSTSEHVADGVTLMIMNCKTYSWNFLNIPYCKEND